MSGKLEQYEDFYNRHKDFVTSIGKNLGSVFQSAEESLPYLFLEFMKEYTFSTYLILLTVY